MGKNIKNEYADGFSGKIGRNMVFRQTKSDEVIIARKPRKSKKKPHEKRLATQKTFKRGALYAKLVESDPEVKALYAASTKGMQSAFNLALRDACKPPVINSIDLSLYKGQPGDVILVDATDDFKVVSVKVSIYAADGELIEQGEASIPDLELDWVYRATVLNALLAGSRIIATAFDMPKNQGSLEITV